MRLDKDTLVKHRFWVLLSLLVPLLLFSVLWLWISVAAGNNTERQKFVDSKKKLEGIKEPKNEKYLEQLQEVRKKVEGKKDEVHEKAWKTQDDVMTWPKEMHAKLKDKYYGDDISVDDCAEYEQHYLGQLKEIAEIVKPVNLRGEGVVEYNGGWDPRVQPAPAVIRYVQQWVKRPLSPEDLWLAQEDLWMQRELLRIVKGANDSVATFKKAANGAKLPLPEGAVFRQQFTNPHWELDLILAKNDDGRLILSPQTKIKNIHTSRRSQSLNVSFEIRQRDSSGNPRATAMVNMLGDPVSWNTSKEIKDVVKDEIRMDAFRPDDPIEVEQMLEWRTAPVKRINQIVLGYYGHRLANRNLQKHPTLGVDPNAPETDPSAGFTDPAAGFPSDVAGVPGPGAFGVPGGEADAMGMGMGMGYGPVTVTANGLIKYRYLDITPQVRRMPIGMVLVVDQAHVQDVLTAFANSRLRIQTTQWHLQRVRGLQPPAPLEIYGPEMPFVGPGGVGAGPGGFGVPGGDPDRPRFGPVMPGSMGVPRPGGVMPGDMERGIGPGGYSEYSGYPGAYGMLGSEQLEFNLVELAVYGVASLYERFPPAPPKEPPADAAGETPMNPEAGMP
jgi:hypothetical protein